jgi:hypothetical protein
MGKELSTNINAFGQKYIPRTVRFRCLEGEPTTTFEDGGWPFGQEFAGLLRYLYPASASKPTANVS